MAVLSLTKFKADKNLLRAKQKQGGRNNHGRITVPHQGGGEKQFYRVIN
jgi:large subunit ribosomal protein L2